MISRMAWLRIGVATSVVFATGSLTAAVQAAYRAQVNATEHCFGAAGPGCDGVPVFASPQKRSDRKWGMKVAVGSILHDNCCRANPNGKWCGKFKETGHDGTCSKEWNKAFYNVTQDNRMWDYEFDPRENSNLTPVNNPRRSVFASNYGGGGTWRGPETVSTRKLAAPRGTNLDVGDQEFCASGRASAPKNSFGKNWITCE